MPFTFVHPAAVVPFTGRRLRLDMTCLIIGAMAPDFEYFAHARMVGNFSHSVKGLFLWSLPVTLLLAWLFHHLIKWPLLLALPSLISRRLALVFAPTWPQREPPKAWAVAAISALLGAFTHIVWDGFTHASGWFVRRIATLSEPIHVPVVGDVPLNRALQHVSTLVGAIILLIWMYRRTWPTVQLPDGPRWRARIAGAGFTAFACVALYIHLILRARPRFPSYGDWAVASIAALLVGTFLASLAFYRAAQTWRTGIVPKV